MNMKQLPQPATEGDNTFLSRLLAAVRAKRDQAIMVKGRPVLVSYKDDRQCQ